MRKMTALYALSSIKQRLIYRKMLAHISLVPQYRDPDYPVTNGAYMIESESVKSIYLTKNPYYWQKNNVAFERVEYLPLSPLNYLTLMWCLMYQKCTRTFNISSFAVIL